MIEKPFLSNNEFLFQEASDSMEHINEIRETLCNTITVPDDGDASEMPHPLDIFCHTHTSDVLFPIRVTHVYGEDGMKFFLAEDLSICTNLVPVECLLPIMPASGDKDKINSIREKIKGIAVELIKRGSGRIYFNPTDDSLECLKKNGKYIHVSSIYMESPDGEMMVAGTDDHGAVETCRVDDLFIEGLCGIFVSFLGDF
jgi:hypothetical protein